MLNNYGLMKVAGFNAYGLFKIAEGVYGLDYEDALKDPNTYVYNAEKNMRDAGFELPDSLQYNRRWSISDNSGKYKSLWWIPNWWAPKRPGQKWTFGFNLNFNNSKLHPRHWFTDETSEVQGERTRLGRVDYVARQLAGANEQRYNIIKDELMRRSDWNKRHAERGGVVRGNFYNDPNDNANKPKPAPVAEPGKPRRFANSVSARRAAREAGVDNTMNNPQRYPNRYRVRNRDFQRLWRDLDVETRKKLNAVSAGL